MYLSYDHAVLLFVREIAKNVIEIFCWNSEIIYFFLHNFTARRINILTLPPQF